MESPRFAFLQSYSHSWYPTLLGVSDATSRAMVPATGGYIAIMSCGTIVYPAQLEVFDTSGGHNSAKERRTKKI